MNSFAIYRVSTGFVDRIYSGVAEEAALQPQSGEAFLLMAEDFRASQIYVADGAVLLKQPFAFQINTRQIIADNSDTAIISNIPVGTVIRWHDGLVEEVTDGFIELSTDMPRNYRLQFTAVPYLDEEVIIEARPAN